MSSGATRTDAAPPASPFRPAAVKAMRRPDDLDEMLTTSDPRAWMAVAALTTAVVAFGIWSVFGSIPEHRSMLSVFERSGAVTTVLADASGTLTEVDVVPGDVVVAGDVLGVVTAADGSEHALASSGDGVVQEVAGARGDVIAQGARFVLVLDERSDAPLYAFTYLGAADAAALQVGADVEMTPLGSDAEPLSGTVDFVGTLPTDRPAVLADVRNEELTDTLIAEAGGVAHLVRVRVETGADDARPVDGSTAVMEITLATDRPIDVLFGR